MVAVEAMSAFSIEGLFALVVNIVIGYILWVLGKKDKHTVPFYLISIGFQMVQLALLAILAIFASTLFSLPLFLLIIVLVLVAAERIAWAVALREVAGDDRLGWFIVIYSIPLFGWLLYRFTRL